jgi:hypothetical protein
VLSIARLSVTRRTGPVNNMAEPFSYQKDIAPYASRLFRDVEQNRFLNTAQRTNLSERLLGSMERTRKFELEDEDRVLTNELKRVRLDADRLALEDARLEAQQKRDALASAPTVSDELDRILDDTTLDKSQKVSQINRLAVANAGTLRQSPTLYYKLNYATKAVEPTEPALTPYQEESLSRQDEARRYQRGKDLLEEDRRLASEKRRAIDKEFRAFDDALDVELEEPESFAVAAAEKEGRPAPTAKFKNPIARTRLLSLVKRFTPDQYEEASKLSPAELVGRAFEIRTQLQESLEKPAEKEKPYSFFDQ